MVYELLYKIGLILNRADAAAPTGKALNKSYSA